MEKSNYAMAKFGLETKEVMPKRDCGFYVKYIFLFTSLIQFLIILGLVLFMVYGNAQAGTDTHLRAMEEQVQSSYGRIIALSARNLNLTRTLNATLKDKQGLQALLLKVQRDLDKCNSSQGSNSVPTLQQMVRLIYLQRTKLDECHMVFSITNASCNAEKAMVRSQLDQTILAMKKLEENTRKGDATLGEATWELEKCQQDLLTTRTNLESTETLMKQLKLECGSLNSHVSHTFQRLEDMLRTHSCKAAHDQVTWLAQRTEGLFLWQQDRETKYVGKSVCDMYVRQCHINCSREKQERLKKLQDTEKQVKSGQEEKKQLVAEKERLSKELEEKGKVAAQAGYFKEQLNICLGSKMDVVLDSTGSRGPGGAARAGPLASSGSYTDALGNQGIFGNTGKINTEDIERWVQKLMEQYTPNLRNPSG